MFHKLTNSGVRPHKFLRRLNTTNPVEGVCFAIKILAGIKTVSPIPLFHQVNGIRELGPPAIVGIVFGKPGNFFVCL